MERIPVYPQQLLCEIIEELHVIDEIAFEQSSWFFQTTVEPFHSYFLPEQRRTFQCTGLKVYGCT